MDTIIYDNTYHFGCHDEYLKEVLEQQSFIEKATAIADANGYEIEYDGENSFVILIIDISDNNIDVDKVSKVIIDILNSVDVPELVIGEEEFSTGEVNYYTESKMREIFYNFVTENGEILSGDAVRFQEKESIVEELAKNIQVELEYAYENLNTEL